MPIVENKNESGVVDQPLCSPNRTTSANPNGALTPEYAGEIVLDEASNCLWKAVSLDDNSWVALTPR